MGVVALAGAVGLQSAPQLPSLPSGVPATSGGAPPVDPAAVLRQYCITCHNDQRKTAGLLLDRANLQDVAESAEVWEKVVRKLHDGSMPPQGLPRPNRQTADALAAWLSISLDRAAAAHPNPGRTPALHRLNRAEYTNAIHDLLAMDVSSALLPPDDSGYGFDNIADVLSVSPMLTERYLSAALKISRLAVGDPAILPVTETFAVNKYLRQDDRLNESLPFASRGGLAIRYYFPVDGDYVVKIFFDRTYDGRIRGLSDAHLLEVRVNGERVSQTTVGTSADAPVARGRGSRNVDVDGMEVRIAAKAGPAVIGISFVRSVAEPEGMLRPPYPVTSYEYAGDATLPAGIGRVELRGPYDVKGAGNSPSRQRIFVCKPDQGAGLRAEGSRTAAQGLGLRAEGSRTAAAQGAGPRAAGADEACAKRILSTLARRAYRRPVTDADLQPLLAFYHQGAGNSERSGARPEEPRKRSEPSGAKGPPRVRFDGGIEAALRRILVSPDFLFRTEHDPATPAAGRAYRISDLDLASRLSFFIWSSIPDDQLLDLATRGQLRKPGVLEQQVRRMFADVRSRSLVSNFAGQWLYLRNVNLVSPDPVVFPEFDENLRQAFQTETDLFLDSQLRGDRSVSELLTADYTFVNERLARHYGIPNVYGSHFRRVTPADARRNGLLGKGSILTLTSYANRTSPVLRGKWLLENILGAPPPPPPPNVPALTENQAGSTPRSVRERLEQHRANPVCASCHKIMDPLGFALENFDAIGRWRAASEAGTPIDASGVLVDGTSVDGPASLRQALLAHREDFVRTVTEKLLTYALGRGVEYYDQPAVRQIMSKAAKDDYRWSALVLSIVQSAPFQMRLSSAPPVPDNSAVRPSAR
jgi:hypothetical protein